MNKKEMLKQVKDNYNKYHIRGCSQIYRVKQNAVFISTANSLEHEQMKLKICYELKKAGGKFITEACNNQTGKIVDIVDLNTGKEIEIVHKHESDDDIFEYRATGVIVVLTNKMMCEKCSQYYPKRSKQNICMRCKNVR